MPAYLFRRCLCNSSSAKLVFSSYDSAQDTFIPFLNTFYSIVVLFAVMDVVECETILSDSLRRRSGELITFYIYICIDCVCDAYSLRSHV